MGAAVSGRLPTKESSALLKLFGEIGFNPTARFDRDGNTVFAVLYKPLSNGITEHRVLSVTLGTLKRRRRRLSPAGRRAISRAAKARWAKVKAEKRAA